MRKREYIHGSLALQQKTEIIFASFSKKNFYLRFQISAFILLKNRTPISPLMNFDYNLAGLVNKDTIRIANNSILHKVDELWVFGKVSDGVLMEIFLAKKFGKTVRFFSLFEKIDSIEEINIKDVQLEDVSAWMWDWVVEGKNLGRWHPRLQLRKTYPLIYPAYSKRNFYWQMHISQFCLDKKTVPLNPFMLFRYFLGDTVPRETIYLANNNLVKTSSQLWVFGEISDGVLAEIKIVKDIGGIVKYFRIINGNPVKFRKVSPRHAIFEENSLEEFRSIL